MQRWPLEWLRFQQNSCTDCTCSFLATLLDDWFDADFAVVATGSPTMPDFISHCFVLFSHNFTAQSSLTANESNSSTILHRLAPKSSNFFQSFKNSLSSLLSQTQNIRERQVTWRTHIYRHSNRNYCPLAYQVFHSSFVSNFNQSVKASVRQIKVLLGDVH